MYATSHIVADHETQVVFVSSGAGVSVRRGFQYDYCTGYEIQLRLREHHGIIYWLRCIVAKRIYSCKTSASEASDMTQYPSDPDSNLHAYNVHSAISKPGLGSGIAVFLSRFV